MPIRDIATMNASLDNDYGATKGANAPASLEVALFTGDPMTDGVEVADTSDTEEGVVPNGYARVTVPNDGTTWAAAADGEKATAAPVQFPAALAEYPGTVDYFALLDAADSVTMWDCVPLAEPLDITSAGDGPLVAVTVFYDDSISTD